MKALILFVLLTFFGFNRGFAQKLPREFVEGISKSVLPVAGSANDSLDAYTVILVLSADGNLVATRFSDGMPQPLKKISEERLAKTRIRLTPLVDWWKKFCKDNHITERTVIAQSVFVRFEYTDSIKVPVDKISEMYQKALSFDDQPLLLQQKVNLIWLPPLVRRFAHVTIVD